MNELNNLSKTLTGYQATRENFAQAQAGKYFYYFRNFVWLGYFLPFVTGVTLLIVQPTCSISDNPISVTGCEFVNFDMSGIIAFYANTHIFGVIAVGLGLLIIKAFFIIKFINVKIRPE